MKVQDLDDKLDVVVDKLERVTILSEILKEKIEEIDDINSRLKKVEENISYAKGAILGVSVILASISGYILDIFKKVF